MIRKRLLPARPRPAPRRKPIKAPEGRRVRLASRPPAAARRCGSASPRASRAIVGIGIDLLDVARMEGEIGRDPEGFRAQVFTPGEIAYCESQRRPAVHYAARFAAKEAVLKALARGAAGAASWRQVEIEKGRRGQPRVILHGKVRKLAARLRVHRVILSLSHTRGLAAASVILES